MSAISCWRSVRRAAFPPGSPRRCPGREECQPDQTRCVCGRDPLLGRDAFEGRLAGRGTFASADFAAPQEKPGISVASAGVEFRDAVDDELHLVSGSVFRPAGMLSLDQGVHRGDRHSDRRHRYLRSADPSFLRPSINCFLTAFVQKPSYQTSRVGVEVDAVRSDLRPDQDGARQAMQRLGRKMLPASRERGRAVPEKPLLQLARRGFFFEIAFSTSIT